MKSLCILLLFYPQPTTRARVPRVSTESVWPAAVPTRARVIGGTPEPTAINVNRMLCLMFSALYSVLIFHRDVFICGLTNQNVYISYNNKR